MKVVQLVLTGCRLCKSKHLQIEGFPTFKDQFFLFVYHYNVSCCVFCLCGRCMSKMPEVVWLPSWDIALNIGQGVV